EYFVVDFTENFFSECNFFPFFLLQNDFWHDKLEWVFVLVVIAVIEKTIAIEDRTFGEFWILDELLVCFIFSVGGLELRDNVFDQVNIARFIKEVFGRVGSSYDGVLLIVVLFKLRMELRWSDIFNELFIGERS